MTIFKYPLKISDVQTVNMPFGAKILTVQAQNGQACLWALVEPINSPSPRIIEIFGTGHAIDNSNRDYVGTVQQAGGALVWHIFEKL